MRDTVLTPIESDIDAATVTTERSDLSILTTSHKCEPHLALPFVPFSPLAHRTFEIGLRAFVEAQTALSVGYVEQLYTFGDRGRHARPDDTGPHMVSVGYLALTRMPDDTAPLRAAGAHFEPWYRFFPWADWREEHPEILDKVILPMLDEWAG